MFLLKLSKLSSVEKSLLCGTTCIGNCLPDSSLDKVYSSKTHRGNLAVLLLSFHSSPSTYVLPNSRGPPWCCCVLQYKGLQSFPKSFSKVLQNLSKITTVPGSTNSRTSLVTKISCCRSGTRKTRFLPVSCSTIPNTWPSETCPRLYFRLLPNIDSSISTVFEQLPNLNLPFKIFMEQML